MRFTVIHDAAGNIFALLIQPPDSPPAGMQLKSGQRITEVDAPDITLDPRDPNLVNDLTQLIANFRVETKTADGLLVRKVGEKSP
jgi:hypothetical protein